MDIGEGRNELAKLFSGVGVEVGVERAVFSKTIARYSRKLYLVDPWTAYKGYREHVTQSKLDDFFLEAKTRMESFSVEFVKKFSMDAVKDFEDASLDFIYIDANHKYENVLEDITEWSKKVKPGGIVSGHDYIRRKGQDDIYGVVPAVQKYIERHGIDCFWVWRGDSAPSWQWYKPND